MFFPSGSYRSYLMLVWPRTTGFRCSSSPRDQVRRCRRRRRRRRPAAWHVTALCFEGTTRNSQIHYVFKSFDSLLLISASVSVLWRSLTPFGGNFFQGPLSEWNDYPPTPSHPLKFLWLNCRDVIVPFASPTFCPASSLSGATGIFDDIPTVGKRGREDESNVPWLKKYRANVSL